MNIPRTKDFVSKQIATLKARDEQTDETQAAIKRLENELLELQGVTSETATDKETIKKLRDRVIDLQNELAEERAKKTRKKPIAKMSAANKRKNVKA